MPKVSIGLPVYNGENFVQEAINSFLSQSFSDFELNISDNASSDLTEEICRTYEAQDERVAYYRSKNNLGAAANYSRVFHLSKGKYFKWAAHDDICERDYLSKCVDILDSDPSVVLCHSYVKSIDKNGNELKTWPPRPELGGESPHRRFRDNLQRIDTFPIWGVMRRDVLKLTHLLGNYADHDRPLLALMSLYGKFYEVPEFLFSDREHENRYIRRHEASDPHNAITWYDPENAGKLFFPAWRLLTEFFLSISRAPIDWREQLACYIELLKWSKAHKQELSRDLIIAGGYIPGFGPGFRQAQEKLLQKSWSRRIKSIVHELGSIISADEKVIVVDEAKFDPNVYEKWNAIPFLEHNGEYWGLPSGDEVAIHELERLKKIGANYICFTWPTFWWFDHYFGFYRYLLDKFQCVIDNNRVVLFDLRA